jgi:hypothetical protein
MRRPAPRGRHAVRAAQAPTLGARAGDEAEASTDSMDVRPPCVRTHVRGRLHRMTCTTLSCDRFVVISTSPSMPFVRSVRSSCTACRGTFQSVLELTRAKLIQTNHAAPLNDHLGGTRSYLGIGRADSPRRARAAASTASRISTSGDKPVVRVLLKSRSQNEVTVGTPFPRPTLSGARGVSARAGAGPRRSS